MSARDEVLARIRLARPTAPVDVPRDYDVAEDGPPPVDLFVERVTDYKATVRRCAPDGLAETVADLLDGVPGIVVPPGVPGDWLSSYRGRILRDEGLTVADLDAPGLAVVTGCAVGIATTGTLVLDAGPDQGRRRASRSRATTRAPCRNCP